jgi:hypothetical protein
MSPRARIAARVAFAALAAADVAAAQFVFPAGLAMTAGNAVMNAPFTARAGQPTGSTRCMVVLDAAAAPFAVGTTLTRLALRRDAAYAGAPYAASVGSLTVRIGRAVAAPDAIKDVRFARLWSGEPTTVFQSTSFQLPAAAAPGGALPGWNVVIPFSANHVWQGGPLAVEFLWTPAGGASAWRCDAFTTPRGNGRFRTLGAGCVGSNGFRPFHYALPETTVPGATLALQLEGAVRPAAPGTLQDVSLHVLGFQALPSPVDLGVVLGTPTGCWLRSDAQVTTLVPLGNPSALFGRAQRQVALPAAASLAGARLYSQWLCFDLGLGTAFPATVSDAIEVTLGQLPPPPAPRRARTVWKLGATGFDIDSGEMAEDEYGLAMRFN